MLAVIASQASDMERLFSDWRTPLIALAVGGFIVGVIGHLVQSRTAIITGIALVFMAVLIFPIALYVRGMP
jgi:cytochrome c oxidase subunit IV